MEEIFARIHTILGSRMKDREADKIMLHLQDIITDDKDGPEFVRLLQKWLASV